MYYFHKKLKIKKKKQKKNIFSGFFRWVFWVFLGGFFIANPVEVSIHGVGLSLVNNAESVRRELAYLTLSSSDIVWEVRKEGKQRYKARES